MRVGNLILLLHERRVAKEKEIFANPPQDYDDFSKRMGIWMGLGEALSIIEDARKSDDDD